MTLTERKPIEQSSSTSSNNSTTDSLSDTNDSSDTDSNFEVEDVVGQVLLTGK